MNKSSNKIHSSVIIDGTLTIGDNNSIEGHVLIRGPTYIGNNNYIGFGTVIGTDGENTKDPYGRSNDLPITIGNGCIIKENVVIHKPCFGEKTFIGNNVFIMHGAHIAHDCIIHDNAVITPNCTLGGIVTICPGANVALSCSIHQYGVVGHYSIAGMGSVLTKNIRPFVKYIHSKPNSVNYYAIKKFGFEEFTAEIEHYVLDKEPPKSDIILKIVSEYNNIHNNSGRKEY